MSIARSELATAKIARELAFALLVVGYGCFGLSLDNAPLQDVPNHLARAHIIADLLFNHGAVYGRDFQVELSFSPYLSGDLILALMDRWMGTVWAARLWIATSIVLLPFAVRFALDAHRLPSGTVLTGSTLSLYVATGWCFTMGFLNYELAMACAFFAYGWFLRTRESNDLRSWSGYVLWLLLGYAMHLSAVVFIGTFVGTSVLLPVVRREMSPWRAAVLLAPPCLLLLLNMGFADHSAHGDWPTTWGTLRSKLVYLFSPVVRFSPALDIAIFVAWLCVALFPVFRRPLRDTLPAVQPLLCVAAFLGLYFALPSVTGNVFWVDVRALPYALLFLVFAGLLIARHSPGLDGVQFAAACLVVTANLAYVAMKLEPENHALGQYRKIAATVPAGATVLPVYTRPPIGRCRPFQSAGSFVTLDAAAMTPYLFAADMNPPMAYFRYVDRGYVPNSFWYEYDEFPHGISTPPEQPDWGKVRHGFQYLLVTLPWNAARIPRDFIEVTRNDVAVLLRTSRP